jgi:hypothetical protein
MSVTSKIVRRVAIFAPDIRSCINSTALAPMAPTGWAIVVRRGLTTSVQLMLSKPVMDTSSGTLTPCSARKRIALMAIRSFPATISVGGGREPRAARG